MNDKQQNGTGKHEKKFTIIRKRRLRATGNFVEEDRLEIENIDECVAEILASVFERLIQRQAGTSQNHGHTQNDIVQRK